MSNKMVTFTPPVNLPAVFQNVEDAKKDLTEGVVAGFPVISVRGRVWRLKHSGVEKIFEDAEGEPKPSIELVLVKANPALSKIYYEKGYEEGDNEAPSCWSVDGTRPDASVAEPVHDNCAQCPNNVWGSKITPTGSKTKLCADNRRVAVAFVNDIVKNGPEASVCLLRVPAASLNNFREYAEKQLHGYPYFAVLTKLSFDTNASYPKVNLRPVRPLTEEECEAVAEIQQGDVVPRILYNSEELVTPLESDGTDEEPAPTVANISDAKAKKKKTKAKKKAKKKAVEPEPPPTPQEEDEPAEEADPSSMLDDLLGSLSSD